jgi:hypothetical protein
MQLSMGAWVSKGWEKTMKPLQFLFSSFFAFILIGCGSGHPNLTSIAVSPATATAESATHGQVGYTAKGAFSDRSSRELSQVDGLSWKTSTTAASIGSTGEATCLGPGVQGTAQLVCQ